MLGFFRLPAEAGTAANWITGSTARAVAALVPCSTTRSVIDDRTGRPA
jgi:hypothetical protein